MPVILGTASLPSAWTRLRYHASQNRLWRTPAKRVCVVAGRGSGKTELARRKIVRELPIKRPWVDPIYVYAMPTYAQVRRVAWEQTLRLIPPHWIKGEPNKSEMFVDTIYGSRLYFVGMDKPERLEGLQIDGAVVDESSDQKPGIARTLSPMYTHRNAWEWRIGVPKRYGVGASEFRDYFERGQQHLGGIESFSWSSEDILTPEQLADAQANLDAIDYDEAFRANWHTAGGLIFHAFDYSTNVKACTYEPTLPLLIGSDFNVNPMCWTISQETPDAKNNQTLDQLFIRNCNTQAALDRLHTMFGTHEAGFIFYGDAAGKARDTSASESDYLQILNDKRFARKEIYYPKSNPLRKNRFSACNAALCNANNFRRCVIDPRCRPLISDLRTRAYKPGTFDPNDSADVGHSSDAWGYMVYKRYPVLFVSEYECDDGITFVSE